MDEAKRINMEAMLATAEQWRMVDAWRELPAAEQDRREAVIASVLITGHPPAVQWSAIAERVARHAWDVASEGHAHPETWEEARDRWMGGAREWCDGHEALRTSHMSARLAARALAEALGYRLDGAPAEVPPPNAWGAHATYERHDRSARATATRALASLLTFSDREGYTLNIDGSRCNPEQDAESRGHNRHRFEASMRALLAFKAAP